MMIKAVLLDLDNTLLRNPDRDYVYAFRESMARVFADVTDGDVVSALRLAMRQAPG